MNDGINIFVSESNDPSPPPHIKVIGLGSAGISAVNRMIDAGLEGMDFVVIDTDSKALEHSRATNSIYIKSLDRPSENSLEGFGDPVLIGIENIMPHLKEAEMVILVAGLGGETATILARFILQFADTLNFFSVAIVSTPFHFEGRPRMQRATQSLRILSPIVDNLLIVPDERMFTGEVSSLADAFKVADDVLRQAVQAICDLATVPGLVNLDFADVKAVLTGGAGFIGAGRATDANREVDATMQALTSPLLEENYIREATGVLINITGGPDLTLSEVNTAAELIRAACNDDANIIFGAVIDENLTNEIRVTLVFTGLTLSSNADSFDDRFFEKTDRSSTYAPDIFIAWDPEIVSTEDYARLVQSLGDLVRIEGGVGVARIRHLGINVLVREGMLV